MVKLGMISGPFQAILFIVITWNARFKLYVPREESFPIPLKFIDVTRTTDTSLDVVLEKNIDDYWNVDGDRELSDTWTGFTRFTFLNEKTTGWIHMFRGETDKKTNDLQARHFVARDFERYVRCVETQRKAKVGYRETRARQCQKITWYLLHWSWSWRVQECHEKCA